MTLATVMGVTYRIMNLALRDSLMGSLIPDLARKLSAYAPFLGLYKHWHSVLKGFLINRNAYYYHTSVS
jgi:hypothetical protein